MLREQLLYLMRRTNAQEYMTRTELLNKTDSTEEELTAVLDGLYATRQINMAKVIRGADEINAIWLTGVIAPASRSEFTINPKKRPPSGSFRRPEKTEQKEKSMQEPQASAPQTAQKVTLQDIRALIIAKPGIKRNDVYKALVFSDGSNKKKVGDLISCLISSKQVTQTDENGEKRLHVGPGLNDALAVKQPVTPKEKGKAEAKEKAHDFKLLAGDDAKPLQQASFPVKKQEAQPAAPVAVQFELSYPTLAKNLAAVAAALPPDVVLGIFRDRAGKVEFTLDTSAGASFNMGESIVGVVNGINALAALQPFAENP